MKNQNKQQNSAIVALICSAMALLATILVVQPSTSRADFAVKDRDFQAVTARIGGGSDGLYILDSRTGNMAVFAYQPGQGLVLRERGSVDQAFGH